MSGSTSVLWFDTYAELKAQPQTDMTTPPIVAVGRGKDTGGIFLWTPDPTPGAVRPAQDGGTVFWPNTVQAGYWRRTFSGAVNVAWFGATGDGSTDDTAAIRIAIAAAGPLGHVWFPPGTYIVSQDTGPDGDQRNPWCLNLPNSITLSGAGPEATVIKLQALQEKAVRPISAKEISGITLRNLTIDGNKSAQTPAGCKDVNCEQQHGVFLNMCTDVVLDNVTIRHTSGDGLYLYRACTRASVTRCSFIESGRMGIHAQSFRELIIRNCQFFDAGIYEEIDNDEGTQDGVRAVVAGCTFSASSPTVQIVGVLFAGRHFPSGGTIASDFVIAGNTFRGLHAAVILGVFSRGYAITGNVIDGCVYGIVSHTDSPFPGGNAYIAIVGNQMRDTGDGIEGPCINLQSSLSSVIGGNSIAGPNSSLGIEVYASETVAISSNSVVVGRPDPVRGYGQGILVYGSVDCAVTRNQVWLPDDPDMSGILVANHSAPYPVARNFVSGNQISGSAGKAVSLDASPGAQNAIGRNASATTLTPCAGDSDEKDGFPRQDRWSFGGNKYTVTTAATPPVGGTWAVGDRVITTLPSAGGYRGWVWTFVSPGPGHWKGFDLIEP